MKTSICLIMDGNFINHRDKILSPHMHYDAFGSRFYHCFSNVTIAARAFNSDKPNGEPVENENISFLNLGELRGLKKIATSLPKTINRLRHVINSHDDVLIRFPGNIATIAMLICECQHRPYHVEVVADPEDYFKKGASRHFLRNIAKYIHPFVTKLAAKRAKTTRYVTSDYLQKKYPSKNVSSQFGFTDVFIPSTINHFRKTRFLEPSNWPLKTLNIANVGMMHNLSKGHHEMITACSILNDKGYKINLTFIGDGKERLYLEEHAKTLGIEHYVKFHGSTSSSEMAWNIINKCDLYLLASYQEGMPRALLEAISLDIPVLSTNVGGIYEVLPEIQLFNAGSVESMVNIIEKIFNDSNFYSDLVCFSKNNDNKYIYGSIQDEYDQYFKELKK